MCICKRDVASLLKGNLVIIQYIFFQTSFYYVNIYIHTTYICMYIFAKKGLY